MGGIGFGGCAPVVAKMSASFQMTSMVWAQKRAKGAAGAGFSRASARRLAASMTALADEMSGMAPLWGGELDRFGDALSLCLGYIDAVASVVKY